MIRTPKTTEEWKAYYKLRYEVLRKPLCKPEGSEKNDGDLEAKHFALFYEQKIVAVARLDALDQNTNQARFVAVNNELQGKGFGKSIMLALEAETQKENKSELLLHARENVLDFYTKMGYKLIEKSHLLYNQIQHYKMLKRFPN